MAVFIPVAVLASGFLADVVSAVPIADQSYTNELSELDDEKKAFLAAISKVLAKPGVAGGILGTFGAIAGGIGSVLGVTGQKKQKRDNTFDDMDDEEKKAFIGAIRTVLSRPGVVDGILGTFGAVTGGIGAVLGATGKRDLDNDNMDDDEKKAFIAALTKVLAKPGVAGGVLGTFGALTGGVGALLGATGKRSVGESAPLLGGDDEDKEAFWALVPAIAGALGGVMGLGAGVKQHLDNKKGKRSVGESTPLLGGDDEDKEAFWALVPAIAGALGGVMGLGAGVKQHLDNKKGKRFEYSPEFDIEKRDLEDMALFARMVDDSEFY